MSEPASAAQGPEGLPDDDVWQLLLGQLWMQPDEQLLCRLLCTSATMARLVHRLCVGKAAVKLKKQPARIPVVTTISAIEARGQPQLQEQVATAAATYRRWLAKHARLLGQLELAVWDAQQPDLAAGLCAAAGMPVAADASKPGITSLPPAAATRIPEAALAAEAEAAATVPAATAAAAAVGAATAGAAAAAAARAESELQEAFASLGVSAQLQVPLEHSGFFEQSRLLPLTSLKLISKPSYLPPLGCPLMRAIAVCPQLTQLHMWFEMGWQKTDELKAQLSLLASSIAQLPRLQDLTVASSSMSSKGALPAVRFGTQLTKLMLQDLALSAEAFPLLPPSLKVLHGPQLESSSPGIGSANEVQSAGDLSHLTALTRLRCTDVDAQTHLPPSLQHMYVHRILDVQPLLGLTQLQDLRINYLVTPQQLQQLAAAIGSMLTSLVVSQAPEDVARTLVSEPFGGTLPLTELGFLESGLGQADTTVLSVAHLGQWRKLRTLELPYSMKLVEPPEQLAGQLQQLTCLTYLSLSANVGGSHSEPVLQPVVDCIVGLSSLRSLYMSEQKLTEEQQDSLKALTHITELTLHEDLDLQFNPADFMKDSDITITHAEGCVVM